VADLNVHRNVLCDSIKGRERVAERSTAFPELWPPTRQQSAAMGISPGQDPVFRLFPYSPSDVGAKDVLLRTESRWGNHSNQLFHSQLILCSFCRSGMHDYSIDQSLSAWGAWPVPGRSPDPLLFISHDQLDRRMAGRKRRGEVSHRPSLALNRSREHFSSYKLTGLHASVLAA
jgi:hypothetical protein